MALKKITFIKKLIFGIVKAFFVIAPLCVAGVFFLGGVGIVYVGGGLAIYYVVFGFIENEIRKAHISSDEDSPNFAYTPETGVVGAIADRAWDFNNQDFPVLFPTEEINIKTYKDTEESLANYKTYNFDYTNKTNPLLEKELFGQLEKVLHGHGLTRTEKNPQITVSMDFFIGKKEQYTPPTTVTNTELKTVWNFASLGYSYGGFTSEVPVTSSHTTPGYTTITYYTNIRLNFLNHSKLVKGIKLETPPLIWIGEADSEGVESDIRGIAPVMFGELMGEFPEKSSKGPKRYASRCRYGGLGLGFATTDWRLVRFVEPFSVAAVHGIKAGDIIMKVNSERAEINWAAKGARYLKNIKLFRPKDPYFKYVLSNRGDMDVELVIKSAETGKMVALKMRPRKEGEGRYLCTDRQGSTQKNAQAANPIGIIFVVFATAIIIYYMFIK